MWALVPWQSTLMEGSACRGIGLLPTPSPQGAVGGPKGLRLTYERKPRGCQLPSGGPWRPKREELDPS